MPDQRDDYEPIIATRPRRSGPQREDAKPLWPLMLGLGGALIAAIVIGLWFVSRPSNEGPSTTAQPESAVPETLPEIQVEQPPALPARDAKAVADAQIPQAPAQPADVPEPVTEDAPAVTPQSAPETPPETSPETLSETVPANAVPTPAEPPPVPVRFVSPDSQVQFELHGPLESSALVTSKVGDVVSLVPGTYRVVASGPQLETFEQNVTFDGEQPADYTVELCAERKHERESLVGQIVEERACDSTAQCESLFMVLSEQADRLVKDRAFREQQCAKWRPSASSEGAWTLDIKCGGPTAASTCRIEISQGACDRAEAPRSVRGTECPRTELQ